eukprot:CAMPEP_0119373244 /NCGR_PEP_ID=MMETSP1334-20130426/24220_1 /TAXON_ID=127549 /ORGANISM="Calcidiscus leptoporus, Strain RCC1130" /LENGTH=66 /DNA_ID=CAMNT_0007390951 /DNA_START=17 /DNA_END=213 /DNA_ORIENTATION=+
MSEMMTDTDVDFRSPSKPRSKPLSRVRNDPRDILLSEMSGMVTDSDFGGPSSAGSKALMRARKDPR